MDGAENKSSQPAIESWEIDLLRKVVRAFRTSERDELEAELCRKLLDLKGRVPIASIRDWKAYLAKFVYNKAANWVRDTRAREKKRAYDFDAIEGTGFSGLPRPGLSDTPDLQIAFAHLWQELDPELRDVWRALLEENGNQARVARRLGKHRNTIRLKVERIKHLIQANGL